MASSLLLATLLLLPCLASCAFPWPDNVTQHKGYIEVYCATGDSVFSVQSWLGCEALLLTMPTVLPRLGYKSYKTEFNGCNTLSMCAGE